MKVFVIFLILIGFVGTTFGQYVGDKIPPGTMIPDYEGDYIFPSDYVDFYYSDSHFEKYSVTDQQYRYDIPYMISNGTISNMSINCSDVELVLNVKPSGNKGWITLALPRLLIDSKIGSGQDDEFIILADSKEIQRFGIAAEKLKLLIIPFSDETSQVSMIGVNYPEHMGANACNGKHEPPFSYLLSPLKQTSNGKTFDEIQCKPNLLLIQKYDGSPACVKPETVPKLVTREWGTSDNWIKILNTNSAIHYEIEGAKITSIEAFSEYKNPSLPGETKQSWLKINLESKQNGVLQITLPRNLVDSKIGNIDDGFFVLLDGTETEFNETKTESKRILDIPFPVNTDILEIIGYGYYNPDFNEFDDMSLTELNKQCGIEKPGSKWEDNEKLCTYTDVAVTREHTIPASCSNGTSVPSNNDTRTIPVLMMQPNSTGTICITYNFPYDWESYPNKDWYPDHKFHFDRDIDSEHFTITANPEWIDTRTISAGDNVTVTYKIHADSNSQGLYDTVIPYGNCTHYPMAVGYDESEITSSDFPDAPMIPPCVLVFSGEKHVSLVSGMDYFELDYR